MIGGTTNAEQIDHVSILAWATARKKGMRRIIGNEKWGHGQLSVTGTNNSMLDWDNWNSPCFELGEDVPEN
jgi:hypothetical protein